MNTQLQALVGNQANLNNNLNMILVTTYELDAMMSNNWEEINGNPSYDRYIQHSKTLET